MQTRHEHKNHLNSVEVRRIDTVAIENPFRQKINEA